MGAARLRWLDEVGLDEAVVFLGFGLLWERRLSSSLPAMTTNMTAWNRWCAALRAESRGRLHPVAHLTLRDREWLLGELDSLAAAGITLAMIGAGPVDGRPLSHPDHDQIWFSFVDHAITPVFHVGVQVRVFDDCWYPGATRPTTWRLPPRRCFCWVPPALALSDLILHGVFDRHPPLRFGVVELSSAWVPQFLLMLDGAADFTTRLNGQPVAELSRRPSEYFLDHVRVSSSPTRTPSS